MNTDSLPFTDSPEDELFVEISGNLEKLECPLTQSERFDQYLEAWGRFATVAQKFGRFWTKLPAGRWVDNRYPGTSFYNVVLPYIQGGITNIYGEFTDDIKHLLDGNHSEAQHIAQSAFLNGMISSCKNDLSLAYTLD
jgi:hypothetical protein